MRLTVDRLGLTPVSPEGDPEAYAGLLRVARKIRLADRQVIGLFPAASHVAVPPVAIQLALSLARLGATPVGVIDANTSWPAFRGFMSEAEERKGPRFVTVELDDFKDGTVTLTTLVGRAGKLFERRRLQDTIVSHRATYAHVILDLTGLDLLGEHLLGFDLTDGTLIVARAGITSENQLARIHQQVPPERSLGALLVG